LSWFFLFLLGPAGFFRPCVGTPIQVFSFWCWYLDLDDFGSSFGVLGVFGTSFGRLGAS
jgi:hypothetical protein